MNKIVKKISTIAIIAVMTVASLPFVGYNQSFAQSCDPSKPSLSSGVNCGGTGEGQSQKLFGDGGIFTTIINVMLFIIGVLSVIMLIYGGIQYTLSSGDSGKVNNAKNTILYAIVGLIIAILSYAIVNFVLSSLSENN